MERGKKLTAAVNILAVFALMLGGCDDLFSGQPGNESSGLYGQVYDYDNTLFTGNADLTGFPYKCTPFTDVGNGEIPGSWTLDPGNIPWTLPGTIRNGKLSITFPSEDLELPEFYGGSPTGGVQIAGIIFRPGGGRALVLYKFNQEYDFPNLPNLIGDIALYYADHDFADFYGGSVTLKKGWNFVETRYNYRADGSYEGTSHRVSQNVEDFLKKGYRWVLELVDG
jgi:hypothetical protein